MRGQVDGLRYHPATQANVRVFKHLPRSPPRGFLHIMASLDGPRDVVENTCVRLRRRPVFGFSKFRIPKCDRDSWERHASRGRLAAAIFISGRTREQRRAFQVTPLAAARLFPQASADAVAIDLAQFCSRAGSRQTGGPRRRPDRTRPILGRIPPPLRRIPLRDPGPIPWPIGAERPEGNGRRPACPYRFTSPLLALPHALGRGA